MTAVRGILGLIAYVAGWDAAAPKGHQLTDGFRRATRRHPLLMRAGLAVTALHCSGDLPKWIDPISGIGWIVSRIRV